LPDKRSQVLVLQGVEEGFDVEFHHPTTPGSAKFPPHGVQRLMRRTTRSETVGTIVEVLFADRFHYHRHRPLQHFVFEGRDADGALFAFPAHAACPYAAPFRALRVQIGCPANLSVSKPA